MELCEEQQTIQAKTQNERCVRRILCVSRSSVLSLCIRVQLIIGGSDASTGRFPYMVSIQKFDEMLHKHAGILIAPDIVLTTADTAGLIEDLDTATASVHPHLLFDPRADSERFSIVRQVTHPDYAADEFGFPEHNVRLLKLGGKSSNAWVRLNFDPTVPSAGDGVKLLDWGSDAGGWWGFSICRTRLTVNCTNLKGPASPTNIALIFRKKDL